MFLPYGINKMINMNGENIPLWVEDLAEVLPHGSGINSDWTIEYRGNYIIARNSYHCMDENGFYDGWQDFSIVIEKDEYKGKYQNNIRLHFHNGHYKADKYMLRDYLEDIIYYCLENWQWKIGLLRNMEEMNTNGT